uniref:G-protein coupled receptors family 1 profile domain-containing protein n=2 Tax=Acrobeloides nanus TaxID=290746 RepID=A0A914DF72_9BILA
MLRYIQVLPLYASPFLLVAISADRFQAICRPLSHYRGNRYHRPNMLALIAWTLAFICSIPQFFIWQKDESSGRCATIFGQNPSPLRSFYVLWFAILAWLIPSFIAGILYYRVCQTVWKSHLQLKQMSSLEATTCAHKLSCDTKEYVAQLRKGSDVIQNQLTEFDRKRVQTVRLTLTIVTCNFFLWAPFCIMNVIQAFVPPNLINPKIIIYVLVLGNLNSCVNPWIYVVFNRKNVKRAFLSLKNNAKNVSRHVSNLVTSPNSSRLNSLHRYSHSNGSHTYDQVGSQKKNLKIRFSDSVTLLKCSNSNQLEIPD